jgi:hypothetical protein
VVQENFETVIIGIIVISILPMIWEFISAKIKKNKAE